MLDIQEPKTSPHFALFNLGFRPFFLGAALFGLLATLLWMAMYLFAWQPPLYNLPPMTWHAHEMIYGYSVAVIAGFLLTAVKNWTGRPTLHGAPLALLSALWLCARILPFLGTSVPLALVAFVDSLFLLLLAIATATPVVQTRQWNNLGVVLVPLLFACSNITFYLGALNLLTTGIHLGLYSGLYLVLAMLFVMGRRVIPFFIEKGVGYPVQLKNRRWLDLSSMLLFVGLWIADLFTANPPLVASISATLFALHGVRLAGWHTHGIWKKPLLWILFLAYGSLITGFALKAASIFFTFSPYLAVHAFAYGGVGMMTIGMMARVTLGHTGRNIFEPPSQLFWIFALLFSGTLARVIGPLIITSHYAFWIGLSQTLWIASFSLFLILYAPMFLQARVDGKDG